METITQTCAGVRVLLRRPSEQELATDDIRGVLKRLLRGYAQDMKLNHRDRTTVVEEVDLDEDEIDFIISGPGVDYEPQRLEYQMTDGTSTVRQAVNLVDYDAWPTHYQGPNTVASFYGEDKVAINMAIEDISARRWFLVYRPSILGVIQANAPVPLPEDFIPMLENEAAILCMPLKRDDSPEWVAWMQRTLPIYVAQREEWNNRQNPMSPGRWQHYLTTSVESQIQPIRRSDRHRGSVSRVRPYVPLS